MTAIPLSELATSRRWQTNFLRILPVVATHAEVRFRRLNATQKEEATAEAMAAACVSYAALARQKKLAHAYPGNIATNAVRFVTNGRHVGGHQNCRDVMSPLAHRKHGVTVGSISPWCNRETTWRELVVESRKVSPADQACFNLDFAEWLGTRPVRERQIILLLAAGNRTSDVAEKLGVSEARISQLRRTFQESWEQFQIQAQAA